MMITAIKWVVSKKLLPPETPKGKLLSGDCKGDKSEVSLGRQVGFKGEASFRGSKRG
jgi:hypothetical protein